MLAGLMKESFDERWRSANKIIKFDYLAGGRRHVAAEPAFGGEASSERRTSNVLRHARWAGTSPHGGVLAIAGDDPARHRRVWYHQRAADGVVLRFRRSQCSCSACIRYIR